MSLGTDFIFVRTLSWYEKIRGVRQINDYVMFETQAFIFSARFSNDFVLIIQKKVHLRILIIIIHSNTSESLQLVICRYKVKSIKSSTFCCLSKNIINFLNNKSISFSSRKMTLHVALIYTIFLSLFYQ